MKRLSLALLLLIAPLLATGLAQTVQTFGASMDLIPIGASFSPTTSHVGDATYVCPMTGRLTVWRVNAASASSGLHLMVFRPQGGDFCLIAEDTRNVAPGVNAFPIDIEVQAGDVLGITAETEAYIVTDTTARRWAPSVPTVGNCLTYDPATLGFIINADVEEPAPVPLGGPALLFLLASTLGLLGWSRLRTSRAA